MLKSTLKLVLATWLAAASLAAAAGDLFRHNGIFHQEE